MLHRCGLVGAGDPFVLTALVAVEPRGPSKVRSRPVISPEQQSGQAEGRLEPMNAIRKTYLILRHLGPRFAVSRLNLALRKVLGVTKRKFRSVPWADMDLGRLFLRGQFVDADEYVRFKLENAPPFFFPIGEPPPVVGLTSGVLGDRTPNLARRIELMEEGRCVCFFGAETPKQVDWNGQPSGGKRTPSDVPWHELPDFDPSIGDVRTLWEPARAAWAIDIARARAHGVGEATAELYWRWVDSWMSSCPPWRGFQWKCGQEASVRMIALTFGFWSIARDPYTTSNRWLQWVKLAWATGYRIEHHIQYAVSQKNNHALSEACGLMWIAHLFPEFRRAQRWWRLGRRIMERELERQLYADGSYVQHSMNYHRVMLQVALLAFRLAEFAEEPFDRQLYEKLGACGQFLFQMMDPATGRVPNYGHNDGSNLLPLSECDRTDFRPVIHATHFLVHRARLLPEGPWDEDLVWLFGAGALDTPSGDRPKPVSTAFEQGGYYTLRRGKSWAMVRCHTYRDRPSHCDPLHVDLWWCGLNLLRDSGMYRYYLPEQPAAERFFKSIKAHNTVEIDGRDPIELVSRFLWLPWPNATVRHYEPRGLGAIWFEGEQTAYDRAPWRVRHRRCLISLRDDVWVVVDDLLGQGCHSAVLRWHLPDVHYDVDRDAGMVRLDTPAGPFSISVDAAPTSLDRFDVVRGVEMGSHVQGWVAPYYGERAAAPTIEAELAFQRPARLITVLSPGERASATLSDRNDTCERWRIDTGGEPWIILLAPASRDAQRTLLDQRAMADTP